MDSSLGIWNKELDDLICAWHEGDSEVPLIEFLGVTGADYAAWVEGRMTAAELLRHRHG